MNFEGFLNLLHLVLLVLLLLLLLLPEHKLSDLFLFEDNSEVVRHALVHFLLTRAGFDAKSSHCDLAGLQDLYFASLFYLAVVDHAENVQVLIRSTFVDGSLGLVSMHLLLGL